MFAIGYRSNWTARAPVLGNRAGSIADIGLRQPLCAATQLRRFSNC
jgi:hypothetical protein